MAALQTLARALVDFLRSLSVPGLAVGTLAFAASTQPSLIPRGWIFSAVISALALLVGYVVGVAARALLRRLGLARVLPPRWRPAVQRALLVVLGVVAVVTTVTGAASQRRQALLWGLEPTAGGHVVTIVAGSLLLFALLLLLGRAIRRGIRALGRLLARHLPRPVAATLSFALIVGGTVAVISGAFTTVVLDGLTRSFLARDATTPHGAQQPQEPERSGSPQSLVAWEDLGYEGRHFVSDGPSAQEITEVTGRPALEPIRVYAGLATASGPLLDADLQEVADAVVAELDRTGAWDREVLAVATTTGTGWVDPISAATLEYLHEGDTAVATMQYSVNPSWVQLVTDLDRPAQAGQILFDAVATRWAQLPEDQRPLLVPFGISLGSFGSQEAFTSLAALTDRASGAVWVGTPKFTELRNDIAETRVAGSPQIHPVIGQEESVRWFTGNGGDQLAEVQWQREAPADGQEWQARVAYVQHPSDGVVWWWWDVAWNRDPWFTEPPGQDVLPGIRWYPLITGMQVMGDMFVAGSPTVPLGYGHNYGEEWVDAWVWVTTPEGWDDASLAELRDLVHTIER
ncbi:alpha/beta hydrolase [Serinibacter salmoneus]|nr:alpha/beta-hydrolase family protein [Serinibacter salmoneus]